MVKIDLQFFGGRGSSSGGTGKYRSAAELEKALSDDINNPQALAYSNAYTEEARYSNGLERNLKQSIEEDGYTSSTESIINSEEKMVRSELSNMPRLKTPSQLGVEEALKARLEMLKDLKKLKGKRGSGVGDVPIIV